jgi:hypothetical protein
MFTSPKLIESVARMNLGHRPVAVAFPDEPPSSLSRIDRASASRLRLLEARVRRTRPPKTITTARSALSPTG